MAASRQPTDDLRRQVGSSPRPPKRRDAKDTPCRNIIIHGYCQFEERGCPYNHDQSKKNAPSQADGKRQLNVGSPSFTPSSLLSAQQGKKTTLSSQSASAAPFMPRGTRASTAPVIQEPEQQSTFNPAAIREFTPSASVTPSPVPNVPQVSGTAPQAADQLQYSRFSASPNVGQGMQAPFNPYAAHATPIGGHNATFYQHAGGYASPPQPLNHHLYFPAAPRPTLNPYQRTTHDFFLSESIRQDLQNRMDAARQVLPDSNLPQVEHFHTLVPLDMTQRRHASCFGLPSWVYKATSSKNGQVYCLRRLEGFRLNNDQAIMAARQWKRIDNSSVVSVHDAFTTRAFGESCLIFVSDYYALSRTLEEVHFPYAPGVRAHGKTTTAEATLWSYMTQISNALKEIHDSKLAARCIQMSKILVTDKDKARIRLNGCAVIDVTHHHENRPLTDYQQEDLLQFGRLMLSLATDMPPAQVANVISVAPNQIPGPRSQELKKAIAWLFMPPQTAKPKSIDDFIAEISTHAMAAFNSSLRALDGMTSDLSRELQNGRVARLMMKLACINERGGIPGDNNWSEHSDRYVLKLFRDYVFHQMDQNGLPVVDIGHMLTCLSKLEAGIDEHICLTSRDEQSVMVIDYKHLKKLVNKSYDEIIKATDKGF